MGVKKLWQILEQFCRTITTDDLKGKVVAIDIDVLIMRYIFSHQIPLSSLTSGDKNLNSWIMQKYCECITYGVKPIFVFDGNRNTAAKERTLKLRRELREMRRKEKENKELNEMIESMIPESEKKKLMHEHYENELGKIDGINRIKIDEFENESNQLERNKQKLEGTIYKEENGDYSKYMIDKYKGIGEIEIEKGTINDKRINSIANMSNDIMNWGVAVMDDDEYNVCMREITNYEKKNEHKEDKAEEEKGNKEVDEDNEDNKLLIDAIFGAKTDGDEEEKECYESVEVSEMSEDEMNNEEIEQNDNKLTIEDINKIEEHEEKDKMIVNDNKSIHIKDEIKKLDKIENEERDESSEYNETEYDDDIECKNLLMKSICDIFDTLNIQYIISNGEAEAECCYLEKIGICDYISSSDSDCALFGGKKIIKDFLKEGYSLTLCDLTNCKYTRRDFVDFGLLLGSDFSLGVKSVGVKRALRIKETFGDLNDFIMYIRNGKTKVNVPKDVEMFCKHIELRDSFPEKEAIEMYMSPSVSKKEFNWKVNREDIKKYLKEQLDWADYNMEKYYISAFYTKEERKEYLDKKRGGSFK